MSHQNPQVLDKAEAASRTMFDAMQGMTEAQVKILQHLSEVQRNVLSQAAEAIQAQFQLGGKITEPREYANAQADLVKEYGQQCVDSINETVELVSQAWQEYGNRFERVKSATGDVQEAAGNGAQNGKTASNGGKKARSPKKPSKR